MNERACIRCQHTVLLEDGHLSYCSFCGTPQIFLSEQLQAELAENTRSYNERSSQLRDQARPSQDGTFPGGTTASPVSNGTLSGTTDPGRLPGHPWTLGVRYALLSAGIALALGFLSLLVPSLGFLVLLWIVSAPILSVAFFNGRSGPTPPTDSGFAARLGLLTGVLVALCCVATFTASLVLSRYVLHDSAALDAQLAASFAQQRAAVLARMGAEAKPTLDMFAVPEFRVGILLFVAGFSTAIYLFLSTVAGGVAGLLLRRRRA